MDFNKLYVPGPEVNLVPPPDVPTSPPLPQIPSGATTPPRPRDPTNIPPPPRPGMPMDPMSPFSNYDAAQQAMPARPPGMEPPPGWVEPPK